MPQERHCLSRRLRKSTGQNQDQGTITLTVPTCIASRYGDKPQDYNGAASTNIPEGLTLQIEVVEANKIASITSPTHKVFVKTQLGTRVATSFADLAGEDTRSNVETALVKLELDFAFLDRDFVLDIVTGRPNDDTESPQAWIESHPTLPNQQAPMLTIPPGFTTRTPDPSSKPENFLLADLSGSMDDKISSLRAAMQFFLKGIPQGRKFNIWYFGSNYKSWQPSSVEYGETSYLSATSWVEANFHANMGGTELLPAVKAIVTARNKRLPTDIIILTDGETWRLDETLEYIQKQRDLTEGRVRFFSLGIGKAVSHALVEGIAKAGGGYAEVVREASEEDWEDRVVNMAEAALMTDHLGPMHLEVNIVGSDRSSRVSSIHNAEQSPADISPLSPFNRNRIYFLFDSFKPSESITSITLTANTDRGAKSLDIPVTILKNNTTIHRLAARSMLEDLERGQSHIHLGSSRPYPGSWDERNRMRKEAERIACKWSLVSKWTSFFLKEEPYYPEPDDTWCAEGGDGVMIEPGDDLLKPRGPSAHIAMVEAKVPPGFASSSVLVGQLVQPPQTWSSPDSLSFSQLPITLRDSVHYASLNTNTEQCTQVYSNYGSRSMPRGPVDRFPLGTFLSHGQLVGTSIITGSSSLAPNPNPETVLLARSRWKLRSPAKMRTQRLSYQNQNSPNEFSSLNSEKDKPWTETRLISELLRFQSAKGYFAKGYSLETNQIDPTTSSDEENSKNLTLLRDFLGEEITNRLRILRNQDTKDSLFGEKSLKERNLFTISVCVLLERDFFSKRSLWVLMRRKADGYLKEHLSRVEEAVEKVRGALEGVKIAGYTSPEERLADLCTDISGAEIQLVVQKPEDAAAKVVTRIPWPLRMKQRVMVKIRSLMI